MAPHRSPSSAVDRMQVPSSAGKLSALVSRCRLAGLASAKAVSHPWGLSRPGSFSTNASASGSVSDCSDSDSDNSPSQHADHIVSGQPSHHHNIGERDKVFSHHHSGGDSGGASAPTHRNHARALACFIDLANIESLSEESESRVTRAIDLLYDCKQCTEDICLVLAHASSYFQDAHGFCGARMNPSEVGNIIAVLMYIAHSYVLDETCPLRVWQKTLFSGQCSVGTLDMATMKLLKVRGYVLRLDREDLQMRYEKLMCAASEDDGH